MSSVEFRRAVARDYPAILRIQSANFVGNMSEEERREGFLSAEFSREQIAAMAEDLGIIVAVDLESVAGYLCGFRREFDHGSPVLAKMLESYDRVQFRGKALDSYNSYIYGPVCIERNHLRRGLLRGLYEAQKKDLAGRSEVGVAFVARSNTHSLQAHVAGLGMTDAGDFEVKGNTYAILVFAVPLM
jgi:hypothetical protein